MPRPEIPVAVPAAGDQRRRAELACIHLGKKALGLDEDTYRDFLAQQTGKRSAAELTQAQRTKVIEAMRARGFDAATWGALGGVPGRTSARGRSKPKPQHGKAIALWRSLYQLGELRDGSDAGLDRWIAGERGFGVSALRFADAQICNQVIEGLKNWCERAGFRVEAGEPGIASKRKLARAIWARLHRAGVVRIGADAALDEWLRGRIRPHKTSILNLDAGDLDRATEQLGDWLRRATREEGSGQ